MAEGVKKASELTEGEISELLTANREFKEREERLREELKRLSKERDDLMGGLAEATPPRQPVLPVNVPVLPKKNLSLQSMIAQWSGAPEDCSVEKFLRSVEDVARCGNWEEAEKLLVARTKLAGAAADCLDSHPELSEGRATWAAFEKALRDRFGDVTKPEQYLLRLHSLQQGRGETVRAFATRCRSLAEKALVRGGSEEARRGAREQLDRGVLAAFIQGLSGEKGRLLRYMPPSTWEEAVERATVMEREEEEANRRRSEGAYVLQAQGELVAEPQTEAVAGLAAVSGPSRAEPPSSQVGGLCYRCGGRGHLARDCATRSERSGGRGPASDPKGCYRCGRRGHWARDCPQGPSGGLGSNPRNHGGNQANPNGDGLRRAPVGGLSSQRGQ